MSEREERFEEALQRLLHWSEVYSRDVFPEPDWEKAGELLKTGDISIDVIRLVSLVIIGIGIWIAPW
jgi:hypothetical protein